MQGPVVRLNCPRLSLLLFYDWALYSRFLNLTVVTSEKPLKVLLMYNSTILGLN